MVDESGELKPTTGIGKAKAKSEEGLKKIAGLPLVIVRLAAYVYGNADVKGLSPRLCIAAVYKKTKETLEYPKWFEENKIPTAHISDAVKAIWHLAVNGTAGSVYNVVDKNETDQKKLNVILEKLFGIKTDHLGTLKSEALKLLPIESVLSEINADNTKVWLDMISSAKIEYTPLSPYLDSEVLQNNSYNIDGSAITKTGFTYDHPVVTDQLIRDQTQWAINENWFPSGYLQ